jgi:hypothetical protein
MPLLLALLLIPLLVIVLIPVSLAQRIRRGTMRRQARRWVVTANAIAITLSTAMFLIGALITSRWVPEVLPTRSAASASGSCSGSADSRSHVGNPVAAWCTTHRIAGSC